MTILGSVVTPAHSKYERLDHVLARSRQVGEATFTPLSVFLTHGVVPRSDRSEENHNRLGEDLSKYLLVRPGDVVFNKLRTWQGGLGVADHHGIVSPAYFVCRPTGRAVPRFLHYLLRSKPYLDEFTRVSKWMPPSQFDITWDQLRRVPVLLPPLEDQRAIADFLDAETARIDAVDAKRRDQLHLLSERQTVIINSLVSGAIQTGAHGVPIGHAGTPSARLGNLAHVQGGLTLDGGRDLGSDTIELPYLRVANVQDGRVDLTEVKTVRVPRALAARCSLAPGDVLMTEGGDPDKLGRGTVWAGLIPRCLHQNHVFAVRPDQTRLDPAYLALMTRTQYARVYFEMTAAKTTGIASTSATKITAFRVPLVDLEAQRSRVADVDRRLAEVDAIILPVTRQIALMKERRQALITATVTGEIDVSTAGGRGVPG